MDFEMENLFIEPFLDEEIDLDYEFDAPKYYDFTRPENDFQAREAECWFETTGSYSPSPFIMEADWQPSILVKSAGSSSGRNEAENTSPISVELSSSLDSEVTSAEKYILGLESYGQVKTRIKSPTSKHSNFMNPTASQLAKQNQTPQNHCDRFLRRSQKMIKIEKKSSQGYSVNANYATKRQRLEAGYSSKVAHLKHQVVFSHKAPKKVGIIDIHTALLKTKVTVPKEPKLETTFRAKRHGSKINLELVETEKSNACTFRARPLNRKILETPSFPFPKKSTPQLPEFHLFHLRTSERAMQHASINVANASNSSPISQNETTSSRRVNPVVDLKEKLEALEKIKARCLNKKECDFPTDKRIPIEPPIDLFSKLFITSKVRSKMPLHSKGLKENAPGSLHLTNETKNVAKLRRHGSNEFQCGSNQTIPLIFPKVNRSIGIR